MSDGEPTHLPDPGRPCKWVKQARCKTAETRVQGFVLLQKEEAGTQLQSTVAWRSIDFCPPRVVLDLPTWQEKLTNFKYGDCFCWCECTFNLYHFTRPRPPPPTSPLAITRWFSTVKSLFFHLYLSPFGHWFCFWNSTYERSHMVFVFLWLISLNIIPSRSTRVVANGKISFFLWWIIFHHIYVCMYIYVHIYTPCLLYPFISGWDLDCFHILAIVNNAAINIGMHISFQISVFVFFG